MISVLYNGIVACNSQGVNLLREGKLEEALAHFQGGLTTLLLVPHGDDHTRLVKSSRSYTAAVCSAMPLTVLSHNSGRRIGGKNARQDVHTISTAEVSLNEAYKEGNVDAFMVFSRALLLPTESKDCSFLEKGQECYGKLISAVLTYNVGLTHHLEGLRKGSSTLLNEALDFYSLAYMSIANLSLIKSEDDTVTSDSGLALLNLLAVLNNTSHIHMFFRGYETARMYNNEISYQLRKHKQVATTFLEYADHSLFFLNVLFNEVFPPRTAPAA